MSTQDTSGNERTPLAIPQDQDDDFSDFKPQKRSRPSNRIKSKEEGAFPSREATSANIPEPRDQLNIRVYLRSKQRFQRFGKESGIKQYALFDQMLDLWEDKYRK